MNALTSMKSGVVTPVRPYLKTPDGKKHRVYVVALIDDASRFVLGADVFFNDTFVNLMSVMKASVSKYGKPKVFNFDAAVCGLI